MVQPDASGSLMAGQPKKRALVQELERRTRETFDTDDATVLDYVEYYTEGGGTLVRLAREIAEDLGWIVPTEYKSVARDALDPQLISRYLNEQFGKEADRRLGEARIVGADRLAEQSVDLVDQASDDKGAQVKARNQAAGRQWIAAKWNRAAYGEQRQGVNINVNIATLHLEALRKRSANELEPSRAFITTHGEGSASTDGQSAIAPAIAVDAEIISIEDTDS